MERRRARGPLLPGIGRHRRPPEAPPEARLIHDHDVDRARDGLAVAVARAVAAHPVLADELVLRGGVAVQHFVLDAPMRRCAGLEYARLRATPIGPVLDALRAVAADLALYVRTEVRDLPRVHLSTTLPAPVPTTARPVRLRVDLETRELHPFLPLVALPVPRHAAEELLGLVLREVRRRSRGRDLFDLWSVLTTTEVDDALVADAFRFACARAHLGRVGRGAMVARLHRHLARPGYLDDVAALRIGAGASFTGDAARRLVTGRLLARLPA